MSRLEDFKLRMQGLKLKYCNRFGDVHPLPYLNQGCCRGSLFFRFPAQNINPESAGYVQSDRAETIILVLELSWGSGTPELPNQIKPPIHKFGSSWNDFVL